MTSITEASSDQQDSGVSSSEATPEGQNSPKTATVDLAAIMTEEEKPSATIEVEKEKEKEQSPPATTPTPTPTPTATPTPTPSADDITTLSQPEETVSAAKPEQKKEETKKPETKSNSSSTNKTSSSTLSLNLKPSKSEIDDDETDEDDDFDESIFERILALSEMFPNSVRSTCSGFIHGTISALQGTYSLTRNVVWIGVSTSVILFAPVMFELERLNVEEMMKQDRNRLVLGPGSAMSGPPGMAMPPPSR